MAILVGGGGGGGKIAVYNQSNGDDTELSLAVTKIRWATQDALGFGATLDPEDPTCVVIGNPPQFIDPIAWSSQQTTPVRPAESDTDEADTYLTSGYENTTVMGSLSDFIFNSTLGRGFGSEARLTVTTFHNGVQVDNETFTPDSNGTTTQGNVSVRVSNIAPDGDGSVFQGQLRVTVDGDGLIGSTNSGGVRIQISFVEQKWSESRNINQNIFRDKNPTTPSITGGQTVREDDVPANRVTKFISGIQYYTLTSPFTIEAFTIDEHNNDSSRPNDSLMIDSSNFGITPYNSSPWTAGADWTNVGNQDTSQGFDYSESKTINETDFRQLGNATVGCVIRDSWNAAGSLNTNTIPVAIDTFTNPSTATTEYFDEENWRLESDYTTPFNSQTPRVNGEGIVAGGRLQRGSALPTITETVLGTDGSLGDSSVLLPNELTDGTVRVNPDYSGHNQTGTFFRRFPSPDANTKANFSINILCNVPVEAALQNEDIRIYLWKDASTDNATGNVGNPPTFDPINPDASKVNSIWLHGNIGYNSGTFLDGQDQNNGAATCRTLVNGTLVNGTFGGSDCIGGVLLRIETNAEIAIEELVFTFL